MAKVSSLKTSQKFKQTPIGKIPVDWELVSTEDILEDMPGAIKIGPFGSQLKKEFFVLSGIKVYGQENVFVKNFKIGDRRITNERFNMLQTCELHSGDIVLSMMGTIGKCTIVPENIEPGIMDSHLLRLKVDENKYSKKLLTQLISNSTLIKRQFQRLSVGGIMEGLSSRVVKQLYYPSPPLNEQIKIASILSTIDSAIDKLDKVIDKTRELKKGLMQQLLSCGIGHTKFKKTLIGEIPVDWEIVQVIDVCQKPEYGFTQSSTDKPVGPKFLRITDIQEGKVDWDLVPYCKCPDSKKRKYILNCGDILFVRTGATTGKSFLIKDCPRAVFASYLIRIVTGKRINPSYLYFIFNSVIYWKQITQQMGGSAQGGVNASLLSKLRLPLPPIDEQKKIADMLSSVDKEINRTVSRRNNLEKLKKGLMQVLLTGKVRVKME